MSAAAAGAPIPEPGSSLQKMQTASDGPSLLAVELERLSAIWMVMSEQQTPGVCADIALFAMQNRADIISALKAGPEGWREIASARPPSKGYFVGWDGDYPEVWSCEQYHLARGSTEVRAPWAVLKADAVTITHWLHLHLPALPEGAG